MIVCLVDRSGIAGAFSDRPVFELLEIRIKGRCAESSMRDAEHSHILLVAGFEQGAGVQIVDLLVDGMFPVVHPQFHSDIDGVSGDVVELFYRHINP